MTDFVKLVFVVVGGFLSSLLGGYDVLLQSLLYMMMFDVLTGVIKYFRKKELSPNEMADGLLKKVLILVVVAISSTLQHTFPIDLPIRDTVVIFYCGKELLSCVLNVDGIIPIPQAIMKYFKYFDEKGGKENNENFIN